ncbi:MAG: helix-turn-helix domain-containing protein [Cyanobacteria bacterium J06649_4]
MSRRIRLFLSPTLYTRNSYNSLNCPTQQVLDVIANKWSVIVLYCLAYNSRRYSEIQQRVEGISQKVLTQTLRRLERNGLVKRNVLSMRPMSVEYSITALGETLLEPLQAIAYWSREHFSEVAIAQNEYDQQDEL